MRRIGLLRAAQQPEHELAAFLRALSQHGYVQGRNFVLVPQVGDGSTARLPELAAALVNQGVEYNRDRGHGGSAGCGGRKQYHPDRDGVSRDPFIGGLVKNLSRRAETSPDCQHGKNISSKVFGYSRNDPGAYPDCRPCDTPDLAPVRAGARTRPQRRSVSNMLHRYAATGSGRRRHAPSTRLKGQGRW